MDFQAGISEHTFLSFYQNHFSSGSISLAASDITSDETWALGRFRTHLSTSSFILIFSSKDILFFPRTAEG